MAPAKMKVVVPAFAGTTLLRLRRRGFDPRRTALRAAHQPARARAGGRAIALRHHARDDGGVVAVDLLQQTAAADGEVVMHLRRMQMQRLVVDDVDVTLV